MRKFLIYKSSAGSGKTFTLVKDYLKIALGEVENPPITYKSILAITFTNKAASEMKERILGALKELSELPFPPKINTLAHLLKSELNIDDEALNQRAIRLFEHILHNYGNFSISTIDSFTHSIIRNFSFDMNLPVNFSIEMNEKEVITKCIDKLISMIGENQELTHLILEFSKVQTEEQKNWQVDLNIKEFVSSALKNPSADYLSLLNTFSISDFMEIRKKLIRQKQSFEDPLIQIAEDFFSLIKLHAIDIKDFFQGVKGLPSFFKKLKAKEFQEDPRNNYTHQTIFNEKWCAGKTSKDTEAKIRGISTDIKTLYSKAEALYEGQVSNYLVTENVLRNLYSLSLINEVKKIIEAHKKEENILFISEFNEKISSIVVNEPVPFIYEKIGERYRHFLVDEFQDTSALQWQNLLPLIDNSLAEGNFNLVVGDGKQSIYRWRGGVAEQFQALPALPTIVNNPSKKDWEITLQNNALIKKLENNFRSLKNIIFFNNDFFSWVRDQHLTGDYKSIYEEVNQKANEKNEGGLITIDLINTKSETSNPFTKTLSYIHNSLDNNYDYADISILVRNNNEGNEIAGFLSSQHVPVVSSEALLLKNCDEVNFIVHVLHYITDSNPAIYGSSALIYLCRNKIIEGITEDEALLRVNRTNNYAFAFKKFLGEQGINFNADHLIMLPLLECCITIINLFRLEKNKNYQQFFLDSIVEFTEKNTNSISSFLEYWETYKEKAALKLPEGNNAVKIMTIHKSKGLEFPVVILPFCNWQIYRSELLWVTDKDDDLPLKILGMNKSLLNTVYSTNYTGEQEQQLLDNINVLYVGLTRASHHLHIVSEQYKNNSQDIYSLFAQFEKEKYIKVETGFERRIGENHFNNEKKINKPAFNYQLQFGNWNRVIETKKTTELVLDEAADERRKTGILIHYLLSKIKTPANLEYEISTCVTEGIMTLTESKGAKAQIEKLFLNSEVSSFFNPEFRTCNEVELLTKKGNTLRPDKIIFTPNEVKIIDFKTGLKSEEHKKQLDEYAEALNDLGYHSISKILVYLNPIEIITFSH